MLCIIYIVQDNGSIAAIRSNPAVLEDLLLEIHSWRLDGAQDLDCLVQAQCEQF